MRHDAPQSRIDRRGFPRDQLWKLLPEAAGNGPDHGGDLDDGDTCDVLDVRQAFKGRMKTSEWCSY